ncbi:hypothetical protein KTT_36700 [Tengunoibacter tsumagoiensis]|uniref:Uncharacterized protein n=1 Tax=Tengunoibacter tsumagoiensis TaxID=2014871 RepID=A0A402A477_9CHLR|nr:hypothetical protein KTT_36700 [Tengunoibacter tsumagoiensis]
MAKLIGTYDKTPLVLFVYWSVLGIMGTTVPNTHRFVYNTNTKSVYIILIVHNIARLLIITSRIGKFI